MKFLKIVTNYDVGMQKVLKRVLNKYNINYKIDDYINLEDMSIDQDLVFLDIDNSGMKKALSLRDKGYTQGIIFYASTQENTFQCFSLHPFDYLLKPLDEKILETVLEEYLLFYNKFQKTLTIKDSRNHPKYSLLIQKIEYIESSNTKLIIHLVNKEIIYMYAKLNDIENEINDTQFLRCHQSYLINMNYVNKMADTFEMLSGSKVSIRVRNKSQIKQKYYQYLLENT